MVRDDGSRSHELRYIDGAVGLIRLVRVCFFDFVGTVVVGIICDHGAGVVVLLVRAIFPL
jgi:hypothetical protein